MLPNAHLAIVERQKLTDYLLNAAHPDNGGKARFFSSAGFSADDWEVLRDALRDMAAGMPVLATVTTVHGTKYVVEGTLYGPLGASGPVRSIWSIDRGAAIPRLVTAYPCG
jgi:hypothetical protein